MKTIVLLFLPLIVTIIEARSILDKKCRVSINYLKGDLKEPQPLILSDTEEPTFVLPNDNQLIVIPSNTSILLSCPGRNNSLTNFGKSKTIKALCLNDKRFLVNSEVYEFSNFTCNALPKEYVKNTGITCLGKYQRYDIGFTFGKHFLPILEICRDDKTLRTFYSKVTIVKEILGFQHKFPRPFWKYGPFYPGYSMNVIYKTDSQVRSLSLQLGSEETARKYLQLEKQQYLNRGHLTARADVIYGTQQTATFWHLNTAPQWASFNAGNWMILENDVRRFAISRGLDLVSYTGVHGVTSLEDINGIEQPLYLHVNQSHKAIPVPRYFWKVIHDPISNRATAFIGLNEPYAKNITKDMFLCTNIGDDPAFSWLDWDPENIEKGVSYVCTVEGLRQAVPTVPHLGEVGVLV